MVSIIFIFFEWKGGKHSKRCRLMSLIKWRCYIVCDDRVTCYKGPLSPWCQYKANPLASWTISSSARERPLKITWLRCSHTDHRVAKIRLHFASRRKTPLLTEYQNSSSKDTTRCPTPTARHAACTSGHWKKRWQQSSASWQRGYSTRASGFWRRLRTHVKRRRRRSSHPNRRIFSGSLCFHSSRHRRISWGSSCGSCWQSIR